MQEILTGVALFTGIVLILAALVLVVSSRLLPVGRVAVTVNDSRELGADLGSSLLAALAANAIYLPSGCGGKGSCGQCRVTVTEGGGSPLAIESSFINRREAAAGTRLACQVLLFEPSPLRIQLPESALAARTWEARVRSSRNVATYIRELTLELPAGEALDFIAGGYIQVTCPPHRLRYADFDIASPYRQEWQRNGLFRLASTVEEETVRAYSLANPPRANPQRAGGLLELNVRIATPPPSCPEGTPPGVVSSYLFALQPGDTLTVSGPFGNFHARDSGAEMIFVGGGAGMAPLRSLILDQLKRLQSKRQISFWYGARSLREAFYVEQFEALSREHENFYWQLVLSEPTPEDEWVGLSGFVHEVLLRQYLQQHPAPEDCEYYLCGPPMMIAALKDMLDELGVEDESILFDDFGA